MKVSIVIPTSRRSRSLESTLLSCLRQEVDREHSCEIFAVSNPPDREVEELLARLGSGPSPWRLTYLSSEQLGANRARNCGLERCDGEVLYFLDDDCLLPDGRHLEQLIAHHLQEPDVAGLGGRYRSPEPCPKSCQFYNALVEVWLRSNQTPDGGCLVLPGGNASYKRRVFDEGLRFDNAIVYGGDETEFNHRLVRRGHRLKLAPALDVVHDFKGTWISMLRRAWKHGRGKSSNPHQKTVRASRARAVSRWPADTAPRPRVLFAAFLLAHYALVQAGYVFGRPLIQP